MIAELFTFKNLPSNYKQVLNQTLEPNQIVYVIKDNQNNPKSITTSVVQAITKVQK
jgi:TRAP-type mannitol/chloroaromatic compound transport system substrate-binding protein